MDTTTSVVATGVVVTAGQWSKEKQVPIRVFVGLFAVAMFLSILSSANEKFAEQFGVLILVAALMYYGADIAKFLKGVAKK